MRRIFSIIFVLTVVVSQAQKKDITLEDIYKKQTFRQDAVSGFRSMQDGLHYSEINTKGELVQMNFKEGLQDAVLANLKEMIYKGDTLKVEDYEFNQDETKLLLFTEGEAIYRRSYLKKVFVYDLKSKQLLAVHDQKVLHATFSPQSDKVAFVYKNNLYYHDLTTKQTKQITTDGSYNIINGNCDWVYEEEFEFTRAFEWSPKGDFLAYYRFDQTAVPEYNFALYDKLYPTDYRYKYPKAGENNSIIQIHCYDLKTGKDVTQDIGKETDIYIPRIKMNPFNNHLIIYRLNRLQNKLELLDTDGKGKTQVVFEETNPSYVEVNDHIYFFKKENGFVYTSEKDGFNHLYVYNLDDRKSQAITSGSWEVTDVAGVDEDTRTVYYISAETSPLERNAYRIGLDGSGKVSLTPDKGWNDVFFSKGFNYFMKKFSKINTPAVYTICDKKGKQIRTLKDNKALREKMQEFNLSELELIQVPNGDGVMLNGWMIKPYNFDDKKEHPLLMYQYSGPGSQEVKNQFGGRDFWWYQMLAQKGYIIVCVDGTGTGLRGQSFKKKTYMQLGKYESDDQIAVANYFAKQTYVDAKRIGIWGWSYGGYMSSICILKGANVFKTAIAVAPVTNWRFYDNIYTERYMRTPETNMSGYDDNSPVNMVKNLKGNYLLIHGTADDNVHFQNSMMMVDELVKNNKDFDSEMYPNKNHGISGGNTRLQLYRKMTNFILEKL